VLVCGGLPEPRGDGELLHDAPRVEMTLKGRVGAVPDVPRGGVIPCCWAVQGSPSARFRSPTTVELAVVLTLGSHRAAVRLSSVGCGRGEVGCAVAEATPIHRLNLWRCAMGVRCKNVPTWCAASAGFSPPGWSCWSVEACRSREAMGSCSTTPHG